VYFPELGDALETPIFDGTMVAAGVALEGPAVIEEPSTTVVVYPGWRLELDPRSFYVMRVS
jgi:N-methylhydantoinase A